MPRLSPRRLFLYLACAVSGLLLFINIEQRLSGGPIPPIPPLATHTSAKDKNTEENLSRKLTGKDVASGGGGREGQPTPGEKQEQADNSTTLESSGVSRGEHQLTAVSPRLPMALDRRKPADPSDTNIPEDKEKAWYMKNGSLRPVKSLPPTTEEDGGSAGGRDVVIWPEEVPGEDRIPDQLMLYPSSVPDNQEDASTPLKKILLWNGASSWGGLKPGRGVFLKESCPVSSCVIATNRGEADSADLILFKDHFSMPTIPRSPKQIWMLYLLECPMHTQMFRQTDIFNWTSTYRTDSTVVAPYERWQLYNENVKTIEQNFNYAANKTKKVAWFVSNCGARNGRLQYARELAKHIEVDIYGACGTKRCPRSDAGKCFNMLNTDYKFYLAFENSNCKDYITEKFFVNGLGHRILPIAMGARLQDYERAAPYKSFLHVDQFRGPKELADFLNVLDKDDNKYNEYFQWKGTGEFINTKYFCRVCALLHDTKEREEKYKQFMDVNEWWRGEGICSTGPWPNKYKLEENTVLPSNDTT